jgi:hypothetical protein
MIRTEACPPCRRHIGEQLVNPAQGAKRQFSTSASRLERLQRARQKRRFVGSADGLRGWLIPRPRFERTVMPVHLKCRVEIGQRSSCYELCVREPLITGIPSADHLDRRSARDRLLEPSDFSCALGARVAYAEAPTGQRTRDSGEANKSL